MNKKYKTEFAEKPDKKRVGKNIKPNYMKNILFCLLLLLSRVSFAATTETKTDSTANKLAAIATRIDKIEKDNASKMAALATQTVSVKDEVKSGGGKRIARLRYLLVLLPCILFILLVYLTLRKVESAGFNFKQAFYNDEAEEVVKQAPTPTDPNATIKITLLDKHQQPVYYPSTSRIIAFLSGLTTLIVVVCFMSYYAYCMVTSRVMPSFEALTNLIFGLGLGVLPYGASRLTAVATAKANAAANQP